MKSRTSLAVMLAAVVLVGITVPSSASATEISYGTLAPPRSPWGKVFRIWAKAVKRKSGGALKIRWYFNGSQGDEKAMIAKMRAGQLDGAAVTAVGLSDVYSPILALQMPGLFSDWNTLDKVRDAMRSKFEAGFKANDFVLMGDGDVGKAKTMSKGRAIRSPNDLKHMKVYRWKDDIIAPVTASVVGYTAVPSTVPGLLPKLSSGLVNVITVPSLAAVSLQWASQLDHINTQTVGVGIGGLLMTAAAMKRVPADQRAMLRKTGKKAGKLLTMRIRKEDDKAFKHMKKKMTVVKLNHAEQARWRSVFKKVRRRLGQSAFPSALVSKLESLTGK